MDDDHRAVTALAALLRWSAEHHDPDEQVSPRHHR